MRKRRSSSTGWRGLLLVGCDGLEVVVAGAELVAMPLSVPRDVRRLTLADDPLVSVGDLQ